MSRDKGRSWVETIGMDISSMHLAFKISRLAPFEKAIIAKQIERLTQGQEQYGPWRPDDGRDLIQEGLEEVLDLSQYIAAKLLELGGKV